MVNGGARYDIAAGKFDQTRLGIGYIDDCFILSLNYFTDYTYTAISAPVKNNTFMLQMSLRTLGPDTLSRGSCIPNFAAS